jgi:hypothetical protein
LDAAFIISIYNKMSQAAIIGVVVIMMMSSSVGAVALTMGGDDEKKTGPGPTGPSTPPPPSNVLTDPVGTPIQCTANDVGSGVNAAVYRYMGGDELRHYPNPEIASSWDSDWDTTFKKIDCKGLTEGDKMPYNATVGEPVQCNANDVGSGLNAAVYRVEANNVLRHYPNPTIASSWDSDWGTTFKRIDCIGFTQGDPMAMKS